MAGKYKQCIVLNHLTATISADGDKARTERENSLLSGWVTNLITWKERKKTQTSADIHCT